MTLEQLKIFICITEQGSFRAAAEKLHRSQPALTTAIQKLEDFLKIQLFSRASYRPKLTAAGKALYQQAKRIAEQTITFTNLANTLANEYEPTIAVAIDILAPLDIFIPVLREFMQCHHTTAFDLHTEALGGGIERLIEGKVQITITENLGGYEQIEANDLFTISMLPVVNKVFYQQHCNEFACLDTTKDLLQIVIKDTSKHNEKYSFGIIEHGRSWSVADTHTKKKLILSGLGWGRLPEHEVTGDIAAGNLIVLNKPHIKTKVMTLSLLRDINKPQGKVAQALWEKLSNDLN